MKSINSKISRKKLYKRIYEPCEETVTVVKVCKDSNVTFYDEVASLLTIMHLSREGESLHVK